MGGSMGTSPGNCRRRFAAGREELLACFLDLVFADVFMRHRAVYSATASHQRSALIGVPSCQRRNRRLTVEVNLALVVRAGVGLPVETKKARSVVALSRVLR